MLFHFNIVSQTVNLWFKWCVLIWVTLHITSNDSKSSYDAAEKRHNLIFFLLLLQVKCRWEQRFASEESETRGESLLSSLLVIKAHLVSSFEFVHVRACMMCLRSSCLSHRCLEWRDLKDRLREQMKTACLQWALTAYHLVTLHIDIMLFVKCFLK